MHADFKDVKERLGCWNSYISAKMDLFIQNDASKGDHAFFNLALYRIGSKLGPKVVSVLDHAYRGALQIISAEEELKSRESRKIGIIGGDGSFSSEAALEYAARFGFEPEIKPCNSIERCFIEVNDRAIPKAMVPILNSTREASWVNETLTGLRDTDVMIYGEQIIDVRHHLAGIEGARLENIAYVHSKNKAIEQCERSISKLFPHAKLIYEPSTTESAEKVKKICQKNRAAIVSEKTAAIYGLKILKKNIQDELDNKTKFIVIGKNDHKPTGKDKTTIILEFNSVERPGLLYNVQKPFAERGISISYLQSIPKNGNIDEFTFYLDICGHREDKKVRNALRTINRNPNLSFYKLLGSYPAFA